MIPLALWPSLPSRSNPGGCFRGVPHAYVPDHAVNMAFLGSNTAGDWAVGNFWGPLGNETRAWLDYLSTGAASVHTTPDQALVNLETTIAIEESVRTGNAVRLLNRTRNYGVYS
jgi:hypothetical protein